MEQHPIPQQISSYEFRLVGSMTLKQFFKIAGGAVVAFLFYASHLPFFVKWPLALASAGFGAALAFLPINERPLEAYITAFFKSVFSPTIYLWQKQPVKLDILDTNFKSDNGSDDQEEEEKIISKSPQLEEFLASLPQKQAPQPQPPQLPPKPQKRAEKIDPAKTQTETARPTVKIAVPPTAPPPQPTAEPELSEVPLPEPPKEPNIVVGMVVNQQEKLVENAIVEIQDTAGNPIRVMRTNRLGQFKTATPIANGEYLILTEKENCQFDILKIRAEGKVIPPIKIKAKNTASQ